MAVLALLLITLGVALGSGGFVSGPISHEENNKSDVDDTESRDRGNAQESPIRTINTDPNTDQKLTENPPLTSTRSESSNRNHPSKWSRNRKYNYFADNYTTKVNAKVTKTAINPENESMSITYMIEDTNESEEIGNETRDTIISYATLVEDYVDNENYTYFNDSWVPKHVNVNAVNSDGEIYQSGFVKYEWAVKWQVSNEWSDLRYITTFYKTLDRGPAHPDYERGS